MNIEIRKYGIYVDVLFRDKDTTICNTFQGKEARIQLANKFEKAAKDLRDGLRESPEPNERQYECPRCNHPIGKIDIKIQSNDTCPICDLPFSYYIPQCGKWSHFPYTDNFSRQGER